MPIESQITRIKQGIEKRISPWTQTDAEMMILIQQVLESDMPEHFSRHYAAKEVFISFRAMDSAKFSRLNNATLNDCFSATEGGIAVLETAPSDLAGRIVALAVISADMSEETDLTADLCLDANPSDSDAGSWLAEDEGVEIGFDTPILLDTFPTDHLQLRLTLAQGIVRSVRLRMAFVGSVNDLSYHGNVIADFAAALFFARETRAAVQAGNDRDTVKNLAGLRDEFKAKAIGFLTAGSRQSGQYLGGVEQVADISNLYWERYQSG